MKLVIAEKPSVARDLARVLGAGQKRDGYLEGNGYRVTWCIGHLVQLATPESYHPAYKKWTMDTLPILPEVFRYQVVPSTQKQFAIVQQLISQSKTIICATDAGREGQLIFEYVMQLSQPPTDCQVQRLWISSMTDEAIREGFASLADNRKYHTLFQSARCRSEADWLVGINFTRLFTLRYGTKLTVGRVQTPTLALLVERHLAIAQFQSEPYYQLQGQFGTLKALWHRGDRNRLEKKEHAIKLQQLLTGMSGTVTRLDTTGKTEDRPLLFDLTELQRESNRRFGYTAQETLQIAQSLYEKHKLITYPRTDSRYLTNDLKAGMPQLLEQIGQGFPPAAAITAQLLQKKLPMDKRIFDDKKVTDHHAILVTNRIGHYQPERLTKGENQILQLILIRILVSFSEKKRYDETKLEITMDNQKDGFQATGRIITQEGWTAVERSLYQACHIGRHTEKQEEDSPEEEQILTGIQLQQRVTLEKLHILEKKTTPPKPYTEATLLTAMEKASREVEDDALKESLKGKGLGTPATRASIIEKLIAVGYVERRKKTLVPTQQGITFIQLVPPSIKQVELTAQWELKLQQIYEGTASAEAFLEAIRCYVQDTIQENSSTDNLHAVSRKGGLRRVVGRCPKCGQPVIESEKSFYCDGFRQAHKCNFSLWKNNKYLAARGVTLTADLAEQLLKDGHMRINGLTSKAGKQYDAIFYMEPGEQYVNFRMEFPNNTPGMPKQNTIESTKSEEQQKEEFH